jgi:hypothetical protein
VKEQSMDNTYDKKHPYIITSNSTSKKPSSTRAAWENPSVLQIILPLQAQRESLLPILRIKPTTFHFGLETSRSFIAKRVVYRLGHTYTFAEERGG